MKTVYPFHWLILFGLSFLIILCESTQMPPVAKVEVVTETHHQKEVADPYRWLEDWSNPEVQSWSYAQNDYARKYLNTIPGVDQLRSQISRIMEVKEASYRALVRRGNRLFAMKYQPPLNQSLLVTMVSADDPSSEKVVVDPNKIDSTGATTIDWYVPSPDGRLVAVSMSVGGSEDGDLHIFETETGTLTDIVIPRVNGGTAGGSMTWLPNASAFYYTRYPYPGERPESDMNFYQQVWYHKLGTDISEDVYVLGKDFPRIGEIRLQLDAKSGLVLVTLQDGDSGRFIYFLGNRERSWEQIIKYEDKISQAILGSRGQIYYISNKNAPNGKILAATLRRPSPDKAKVLIPETEFTIVSSFYYKSKLLASDNHLFVTYQTGGPSEIKVFTLGGKEVQGPEIAMVSSVDELAISDGELLFRISSYVEAPSWYRFKPGTSKTEPTALTQESPVDFSDLEVNRVFTASKDGTRIPLNIIHKKGLDRNGTHPALLTGYGGFNVSNSPRFRPINKIWLERGGIYAVANIRGGGEFGESWHNQGRLLNKQNCFDDFAAAMQYLIDAGYTSPEKLAITGGSNGGLLMGAMITQHPELFRVTVSTVGLYDMIRSELTPNGSFNIPEYGSVKDPEQFEALLAYSPYHNVKEGTPYPSVLFMTGANDPRVDPMHSRKMTARLQAATTSGNAILLRTSSDSGHGGGTSLEDRINETAHKYAFLFHEMGIELK